MKVQTPLQQAWRAFWVLKRQRSEATWARLLISTGSALTVALVTVLLTGLFSGNLANSSWWLSDVVAYLFITVCITYAILHALYRGIERVLPTATINRMAAWRDWRASLVFSVLGISGVLLGGAMGSTLISLLLPVDAWGFIAGQPQIVRTFLLITVVITCIHWLWSSLRAKRQALKLQATESQLRLLQAQIEPHFLFNTLANVQSLMDHDTQRAKLMLEAFTEYLRASLSQLRSADSTLGAELDMAQSYLLLLQIRMDERLRFVIEADEQARAAIVPPLLLQPLVENAIQHGLEPKVEGGEVRISARVNDARLEICVNDDGLGLDVPRRGARSGQGVALENIRARLKTRYADNAELSLQPLLVGTRACLNIPYNAKPCLVP
jgi:two-component sensor histidine kinase